MTLPWKWIGAVAGVLALLGGVYAKGWRDGSSHEKAAQAARVEVAKKKVIKVEAKAADITEKTAAKVETHQAEIRTITRTLIERVPYAVVENPGRPSLSVGFVRLHDAAVLGVPEVPDPAGRPDDALSGYGDAQLSTTDIGNYGACRAEMSRLADLQDWIKQQAANN